MKTTIGLMTMAAAMAMGADSGAWSDVQSLRTGQKVGVIRTDHKRVEGTFEGASQEALVIRAGGGQVMIARSDAVRVYKKAKVNRWKRALIGAGAGVAVGAIVDANRDDGFEIYDAWEKGAIYGGGFAAGAAVGAVSGGGDETVYRRTDPVERAAVK